MQGLDTPLSLFEIKTELPPLTIIILFLFPPLQTGVLYWPFVQAFNFTFVPARNRAVVVGVMSFFWTVGLSFVKNQEHSGICDQKIK